MNNIYINKTALSNKVTELENIDLEMGKIFENLEKEVTNLIPFWDTRTSEVQFEELKKFFEQLHAIRVLNQAYANFLKNNVIASYEKLDTELIKSADETLNSEGA